MRKYRIVKVSQPISKPMYAIERTGLFGVKRYISNNTNNWWGKDNIDYCIMDLKNAVWRLDVLINGYPEAAPNEFTISLTDQQLYNIIIDELRIQLDYCDDDNVKLACKVLLNFYGEDDE